MPFGGLNLVISELDIHAIGKIIFAIYLCYMNNANTAGEIFCAAIVQYFWVIEIVKKS